MESIQSTTNYSRIFRLIFERKTISKQEIATELNLSLPTVSQSLEKLEEEGLIQKKGFYKSTGGRPASSYVVNSQFRVSVGVELLPSGANLTLVDLLGNAVKEESVDLTFSQNQAYFNELGNRINSFVVNNVKDRNTVLGVDFSLPGIISEDKNHVIFAEVLKSNDIKLSDFSECIDFPCGFYHDAEANTQAELWLGERMENAHYFFLNKYFCSALILNGHIQNNKSLSSGTIEHMILHTDGRQCYCGKRGCVDAYCSATSLAAIAGTSSLDDFFLDLRNGDSKASEIWNSYLENLAQTIDNARMVLACDVVIGGLVQRYMTDSDIKALKEKVLERTTFKNSDFSLKKGICGRNFTGIGASITRISSFISSI